MAIRISRDAGSGAFSSLYRTVRKHRNLMFSVLFASFSSLASGRGFVCYTRGLTEGRQSHLRYDWKNYPTTKRPALVV